MITGFAPIIAPSPTIMILGSMPSVASLEQQEYYGFKHNRFWKIMEHIYHMPIATYEQKCQIILHHHLILWDVIGSCEREGSLDSAIHYEVVNDIEGLINQYPTLSLVLCNGRKSYDLFQKHFSHVQVACLYLPSTSNANRSISQDELFQQWMKACKL